MRKVRAYDLSCANVYLILLKIQYNFAVVNLIIAL